MQLVILAIIFISGRHVDKIVVSTKRGIENWIKGVNSEESLLQWLVVVMKKRENVGKKSVYDVM